MIDPFADEILTLAEAARLMPPRRAGRRCHVATIYRWTKTGCRGIVLESIQLGATRCTSKAAVRLFVEQSTAARGAVRVPCCRSLAERKRAAEDAAKKFDEEGI